MGVLGVPPPAFDLPTSRVAIGALVATEQTCPVLPITVIQTGDRFVIGGVCSSLGTCRGRLLRTESIMKPFWAVLLLGLTASVPAIAALKPGTKAPDFSTRATIGGKQFNFSMSEALKKGPVVLYFYPAAFTPGCTIEAHNFAEAVPEFQALGATVIGVSRDKIETLDKFSVQECRSAFPVASDASGSITRSYDATLSSMLALADRTSYVISPDGTVLYAYRALDPDHHVENTLKAVSTWAAGQKTAH